MNHTTVHQAQPARGVEPPFGPLQELMRDESVEEIWINRPNEIWFFSNSKSTRLIVELGRQDIERMLERMLRATYRRLDRSRPFIDATLSDGSRLHAVVPDITRENISINIRKFAKQSPTLEGLLSSGFFTQAQFDQLVGAVQLGGSILVSGATQAGKTTLLTAILNSFDASERVVSVEDTFELKLLCPDWVAMQTRPTASNEVDDVDLRRLLRESLRMRPTRLAVGEVRGAEAIELLVALNSGIPAYCTIHANSAIEAIDKLVSLPLMATTSISSKFVRKVFERSVSLVVHCQTSNGVRRVTEVLEP